MDSRVHCQWLKGIQVALLPEPSLRFCTNCLLKPELKVKKETVCVGGIRKASALGLPGRAAHQMETDFYLIS